MGRDLLCQFEAARQPWDSYGDLSLSGQRLHDLVYPIPVFSERELAEQQQRLEQIEVIQPAIGLLSLSHLALLQQLGLKPDSYAGHSYGEIPALYAAGVIDSADEMLAISCKRAELMAAVSQRQGGGARGGMSAIFCSPAQLEALLQSFEGSLSIANINSRKQSVVTGAVSDLATFEALLTQQQLRFRRLNVPTAFHSDWVAAAEDELAKCLHPKRFHRPRVPIFSNLTGKLYPDKSSDIKAELSAQLANQVHFMAELEQMHQSGVTTFIEAGPGRALSQMVRDTLGEAANAISLDLGPKVDSVSAFWRAMAQLHALGVPISLSSLWNDFAPEERPLTQREGSQATVMINGANFGKPYPPKGGSAALPKANETAKTALLSTPTHFINPLKQTVTMNSTPPHPQPQAVNSTQPAPIRAVPEAALSAEWLTTIEAIQQSAFQAQQAFQQTLAQSHQGYLQATQQLLSSLVGVAAGAAPTQTAIPAPPPPRPAVGGRARPPPPAGDAVPLAPPPAPPRQWLQRHSKRRLRSIRLRSILNRYS
ncbi:acyltransferase domain-containing protein [Ectothiorhodospiraceae bacterium BW-2]|nr:acyltransferase domain-containing protein [Ectothiorhodospiraceae bacterium BW-2]